MHNKNEYEQRYENFVKNLKEVIGLVTDVDDLDKFVESLSPMMDGTD